MFIQNKIEHFNKLTEVVVFKFKALLYPEGILLNLTTNIVGIINTLNIVILKPQSLFVILTNIIEALCLG